MKYLILLVFLLPYQCLGLSDDRDKEINIEADVAIADDKSGIAVYSGNVTINQGSMHITADEVKVIRSEHKVLQIIASMKPGTDSLAHYEQLNDKNQPVSADARKITYFLQEKRIHLAGNAKLKQAESSFSGELLHYDLSQGIVKGGSETSGGRIKITLKPD